MSDTPAQSSAPHEGQLTAEPCLQCGEQKVLLVYQRFSSRVLLCMQCEYVWTDEPGGEPSAPAGSGDA